MFDKIIFSCPVGSFGDMFLARGFIKYVINNIKSKEYIHTKTFKNFPFGNPINKEKIYNDIDGLIFSNDYKISDSMFAWFRDNNILYINTWCTANHQTNYNKCGNNVGIPVLYDIFKDGLKNYCNHNINKDVSFFIPDINYSLFKISNIDIFMQKHKTDNKILIDNGNVSSGQSNNFDFNPIIDMLSLNNPKIMFFITHNFNVIKRDNVFICSDIINIDENDIVETSYFSNFCSTIIGRSSGVYTYCLNKENILLNPKQFLCFANTYNLATLMMHEFVDNKHNFINLPMGNNTSIVNNIQNYLRI